MVCKKRRGGANRRFHDLGVQWMNLPVPFENDLGIKWRFNCDTLDKESCVELRWTRNRFRPVD